MFSCCCSVEDQGVVVTLDAAAASVDSSLPAYAQEEPGIHDQEDVVGSAATREEEGGKGGLSMPVSTLVEEEDAPLRGFSNFTVKLTRPGRDTSWGLIVDLVDEKTIYVCDLVAGAENPVQAHNVTSSEDRQVKVGDYIVRVNNVSCTSEGHSSSSLLSELLHDEITKATTVELLIRRPFSFECRISKGSEALALEVNFSDKSNALVIAKLGESLAKQCIPEIFVGDRITCVNGVTGSPNQLVWALQEATDPLRLKICRPMPM